jgi:membrane-bound metal-dependent hydrolase YbcI (DUF457 family)
MLIRTHLALSVLAVFLFLPHVSSKFLFIIVCLVATFIPDIDSGFSTLGKRGVFRVLQVFTKHRGFIHSFTFCLLISLILAVFWPVASLGFFLGYGLHLFSDSFTREGITPFWPYNKTSSWRLKTGGRIETSIFVFLLLADLFMLVVLFL